MWVDNSLWVLLDSFIFVPVLVFLRTDFVKLILNVINFRFAKNALKKFAISIDLVDKFKSVNEDEE